MGDWVKTTAVGPKKAERMLRLSEILAILDACGHAPTSFYRDSNAAAIMGWENAIERVKHKLEELVDGEG